MRYYTLKNSVVHMFFLKKVLKKSFSKVTSGWLLQLLLFHIFLLKYFLWLFFNKLSNHFRFISKFEITMTCVGVEVVIICWKIANQLQASCLTSYLSLVAQKFYVPFLLVFVKLMAQYKLLLWIKHGLLFFFLFALSLHSHLSPFLSSFFNLWPFFLACPKHSHSWA
jgi:hypothetical protein